MTVAVETHELTGSALAAEVWPTASPLATTAQSVELSLLRCRGGGKRSFITILAWSLQAVCVLLFALSLVETIPFVYYRELER